MGAAVAVMVTIESFTNHVPIEMLSAEITQVLLDDVVRHHEGVEALMRDAANALHAAGKPEADAFERTADTLGQEAEAIRGVVGALHSH